MLIGQTQFGNGDAFGFQSKLKFPYFEHTFTGSQRLDIPGHLFISESFLFLGRYTLFNSLKVYDNYSHWDYVREFYRDYSSDNGYSYSFDLSLPLFSIRKGIWTPTHIFIGDIFLTFFYDYIDHLPLNAFGAQFELEIESFLPSTLRLGISSSSDHNISPFIRIDFPIINF